MIVMSGILDDKNIAFKHEILFLNFVFYLCEQYCLKEKKAKMQSHF